MKKALAFLLISALVLSFSACGGERGADFASDQFLEQYDYSQDWNHIAVQFFKSGDTACFYPLLHSNDNTIHFAIPETGDSGVLCGKPECKHLGETCNAYVYHYSPLGLCRYDGRIYWVDGDSHSRQRHILSCAPDGTDRKVGAPLDSALYDKLSNDIRALFHRGYLYLCGDNNAVSDAIPRFGSLVYCVPIDGSSGETVILDKQYPENTGVSRQIQAYRTGVYIAEHSYPTGVEGPSTLALYRWDTVTQTLETLLEQEVSFDIWEMYITEEGILLSSSSDGVVYQYSFATGELAPLFDFNAGGGTYEYIHFSGGRCFGRTGVKGKGLSFRVTDLAGNIVFEEVVEIPGSPESDLGSVLCFCGADTTSLYYLFYHIQPTNYYNELIAVDMPTGACRTLWTDK